MSNIYLGLRLLTALTRIRLQQYGMFEVLLIVKINKSFGLEGIRNIHLQKDMFPYMLARVITHKE
jgi:hypothetical protein